VHLELRHAARHDLLPRHGARLHELVGHARRQPNRHSLHAGGHELLLLLHGVAAGHARHAWRGDGGVHKVLLAWPATAEPLPLLLLLLEELLLLGVLLLLLHAERRRLRPVSGAAGAGPAALPLVRCLLLLRCGSGVGRHVRHAAAVLPRVPALRRLKPVRLARVRHLTHPARQLGKLRM